jgi:hypothetical protein
LFQPDLVQSGTVATSTPINFRGNANKILRNVSFIYLQVKQFSMFRQTATLELQGPRTILALVGVDCMLKPNFQFEFFDASALGNFHRRQGKE